MPTKCVCIYKKPGLSKGGENFFSNKSYKKGIKRGNAWFVNGRWYSYRNLFPVKEDEEEATEKRLKKSKYKFDKYMIEEDNTNPTRLPPTPIKQRHTSIKKLSEIGRLEKDKKSFLKNRKGRTEEDIEREHEQEELDDVDEGLEAMNNYRPGMRLRTGKVTGAQKMIRRMERDITSKENDLLNITHPLKEINILF